MPTNIELKARARDVAKLIETAARLSDSPPVHLDQDDTFFATRAGRLKLRVIDSTDGAGRRGELIFYTRADATGPRESNYIVVSTPEPDALRDVLAAALGIAGRVRKRRALYLAGQTRIHIDDVEGLGAFVELETVLRPGQGNEEGTAITDRIASALGMRDEDLVDRAYVDLLRDAAAADRSQRDVASESPRSATQGASRSA
jgi:adenylate cyclase class IV